MSVLSSDLKFQLFLGLAAGAALGDRPTLLMGTFFRTRTFGKIWQLKWSDLGAQVQAS